MSGGREKLFADFDPSVPLERTHTLPSRWYTEPEIAALERERVFGDVWQAVGRAEQVAEPGAFLTAMAGAEPILAARDEAGTLRAFYNVCRHRAAKVACEASGRATRFRCRYHGWTYDLAGRLRGAPEFDGVEEFAREENGLVELAVQTWGPFVFVHPGTEPDPLEDWLRPLESLRATLGDLRFFERREYELGCNWKVFVDNYLDGGYHVNTIHPGLAGVLDYSRYRSELHGATSVQRSPLRPAGAAADSGDGPKTADVRVGEEAFYWWVFPNFMINVYGPAMDTNLVLPEGHDRCRVLFDFYFANSDDPAAERFRKDSIAVSEQIQAEDASICEEVQRGLQSRSYDVGRFSVRRESTGHHFHQLLVRKLAQSF